MNGTQTQKTSDGLLLAHPNVESVAAPSFWARFALQDWLTVLYFTIYAFAVTQGNGDRAEAFKLVAIDAVLVLGVIVWVRTRPKPTPVSQILYRVALIAAALSTFSQLHILLPAARTRALDQQLYDLDLRLFGIEPSTWFDQFVSYGTMEWFSFFYFSYFFIQIFGILPISFGERRVAVFTRFSLGLLFVFFVGQVLYLAVPAFGPRFGRVMTFQNELHGGTFWGLVEGTVGSGHPDLRTDVFPSLHTGLPLYLALFCFRERKALPYKYVWPVIGFFSSQIIISTMFLRWHYLIDVVAGIALAVAGASLGGFADRVEASRKARGLPPTWSVCFGEPKEEASPNQAELA